MSPESPSPSAEKGSEQNFFAERAKHLREKIVAFEHDGTEAQRTLATIDDYVQDILDAADRGEIVSSSNDAMTYSRSDLVTQIDEFVKELNSKGEMKSLNLIPRSKGVRNGFAEFLTHEATAQATIDVLQEVVRQFKEQERAKHEALRSEAEIDKIGDEALEAAGVVEPIDPMQEARQRAQDIVGVMSGKEQKQPVDESELESVSRELYNEQEALKSLYAEHRKLPPESDEAVALKYQIESKKADIGSIIKKKMKLEGNQKWH